VPCVLSLAELPSLQKSAAFYGKILANSSSALTLALLVALVAADHVHHAAAADDLAVLADLLDGRTDLHFMPSSRAQPPEPLRP
jgi:hypothetical protein